MTARTAAAAKRRIAAVVAAAGIASLAACGSGDGAGTESKPQDARPELSVSGAYMPEPVTEDMAGGFLTVKNRGGADRLTSVESDAFGEAGLHKTTEGQMRHVKSLPVPADGTLRLERGGNHIMFLKPERKPVKGEKVRVTLHFSRSGDIDVTMPVEATNFVPKK